MADSDTVFELMIPGHPYTSSEIAALVGEHQVSGRRALESLLEEGRVWKKNHTDRASTYGVPHPGVEDLEGGQVVDAPDKADPESDPDSDALTATSD